LQTPSAISGESNLISLTQHFSLPWSAYVRLLSVKNEQAHAFYETEDLRGGWTVRQLDRQISSQFYERTALPGNMAGMLEKGEVALLAFSRTLPNSAQKLNTGRERKRGFEVRVASALRRRP
jgi:hypothetical protein